MERVADRGMVIASLLQGRDIRGLSDGDIYNLLPIKWKYVGEEVGEGEGIIEKAKKKAAGVIRSAADSIPFLYSSVETLSTAEDKPITLRFSSIVGTTRAIIQTTRKDAIAIVNWLINIYNTLKVGNRLPELSLQGSQVGEGYKKRRRKTHRRKTHRRKTQKRKKTRRR